MKSNSKSGGISTLNKRTNTVAVGCILNCEYNSNFSTLECIFSSKLIGAWDKKNMGSYQHMGSYSKGNGVIILGILPDGLSSKNCFALLLVF